LLEETRPLHTILLLFVADAPLPLLRHGVRTDIAEAPTACTVVGEAAGRPSCPAVAGRDGLPAIRTLTRRPPDAAVSVVTDRADEETPSYALTYGAAASLPKRVGAGDLRDVLRRVARAESPSSMIACSRHRSWPRMRARSRAQPRDVAPEVASL